MKLLLNSSSKVHGFAGYLEQPAPIVKQFLGDCRSILFVPYAFASTTSEEQASFDAYVAKVQQAMGTEYKVSGIHSHENPVKAVEQAQSVWIGGGNTFLLLKRLYENKLVDVMRARAKAGVPFIGHSAGSNVLGRSIRTTNDMPIAYPPSFDALNLVPFCINPHFIEADPTSSHQGETREQRLSEFLAVNPGCPVLGLKEGCALKVVDGAATIVGCSSAILFPAHGEQTIVYNPSTDVSHLLK